MDPVEEKITITLSKAASLVLFELVASSYETWRKTSSEDEPMMIEAKEFGQRAAFWELEATFESTLVEVFSKNYKELVADSNHRLEEFYGKKP